MVFIFSLFVYFYLSYFLFLSSARTAPETGHSRLLDPGNNRIKVTVKGKYAAAADDDDDDDDDD